MNTRESDPIEDTGNESEAESVRQTPTQTGARVLKLFATLLTLVVSPNTCGGRHQPRQTPPETVAERDKPPP